MAVCKSCGTSISNNAREYPKCGTLRIPASLNKDIYKRMKRNLLCSIVFCGAIILLSVIISVEDGLKIFRDLSTATMRTQIIGGRQGTVNPKEFGLTGCRNCSPLAGQPQFMAKNIHAQGFHAYLCGNSGMDVLCLLFLSAAAPAAPQHEFERDTPFRESGVNPLPRRD